MGMILRDLKLSGLTFNCLERWKSIKNKSSKGLLMDPLMGAPHLNVVRPESYERKRKPKLVRNTGNSYISEYFQEHGSLTLYNYPTHQRQLCGKTA